MHRIRITCLAVVLAAGSARAGIENAGTTAGNFLSVGTGASVLSMGGATLGTGEDLPSAAWNPAALARLNVTQFALSHATLSEQSTQDLAAAGGRVGSGATRWAASLLYQGEGGFDGRGLDNEPNGTFNVSSMAVGVQVAHPFGEAVTAGLGGRWLSDNLGDTKGSGLAFDVGLQARTGPFGIGIAARNVGGSMSYPSGRFDLPAIYGVGAAWSDAAHGLRLALDANFPHAYYNDVRVGGEWRWQDRVALRAGYRMELAATGGEPLGGPSFGMGAGANGVWVDYAFLAGNADAQGRHRLGLTFHPGILNGTARPNTGMHAAGAAPAEREAIAVAAPAVARGPVAVAPAPLRVTSAQAAPAPVVVVSAPVMPAVVAVASMPPASAPPTIDVAKRLPPGGSESEARPRHAVPSSALSASRPVRVAALVVAKPTGSVGDTWVARAPVSAQSTLGPLAAAAPALAPPVSGPAIVAPSIVAPAAPVPAAPKRTASAQPVSAPSIVAPSIVAPTAAPVARGPSIVAPSIVAPAIAASAAPLAPAAGGQARRSRAARVPPSPTPVVPEVTAPVPAPEASAPSAPQAAPSAPQGTPAPTAPTAPAKTSPWPTVSAVLPSVQLAGSSPKVAVVSVPANAPSTAPITRSVMPAARPLFVISADGETLESIARRWDTSVPALMMENDLVNLTLKPGRKLKLPPPLHR